MASNEDIANLKAKAEKATPGTWYAWRHRVCQVGTKSDTPILTCWTEPSEQESNDAKFVAAANPATILSIIQQLKELRELAGKAE